MFVQGTIQTLSTRAFQELTPLDTGSDGSIINRRVANGLVSSRVGRLELADGSSVPVSRENQMSVNAVLRNKSLFRVEEVDPRRKSDARRRKDEAEESQLESVSICT